jgi:chromosome segregation ATPase
MVRTKDEMILELKRQIDQLGLELENYRNKAQDLGRQITEKQETLRRTVKALRLALTMLEGGQDEGSGEPTKKAK